MTQRDNASAPATSPIDSTIANAAASTTLAPTPGQTDASLMPTMYPVIDPAFSDGSVPEGTDVSAMSAEIATSEFDGATAAAVIAETNDGRITSTLTVRAGVRFSDEDLGPVIEGVSVFGVAGTLYENSEVGTAGTRTVVWGTPPYFVLDNGTPFLSVTGQPPIAGAEPLEFLEAAGPDVVTLTVADEDGPVDLTLGPLPEGFEVLVPPQVIEGPVSTAMLRLSLTGGFVEVSPINPLIGYTGALNPVDINGTAGYEFDDGAVVIWQVDDTTWARAVDSTQSDAIELARSTTFTDLDNWTSLYNPEPAPTGPEFVPITGPYDYPTTTPQTGSNPVDTSAG